MGGGDNLCFIATSACAMVPAQPSPVVGEWWAATVGTVEGSGLYFADTLRMLSLTFQAGLFQPPASFS